MKYIPLFNDDYRVIAIGTVSLIIIAVGFFLAIFKNKIPFMKKMYRNNWFNKIMFYIGIIIGISVTASNNFQVFDEGKDGWIAQSIYLIATFVNLFITIMFISFLLMLPFRFFTNIYMFLTYRRPWQKFWKATWFYFLFASIALLVSALQYFFKDSFFAFASNYSNNPIELNQAEHPTLYYLANYFLIKIFRVKELPSTVFFIVAVLAIILIEFLIIKIMYYTNPSKLNKLANISNKIADKVQGITCITPIFTFTAILTSLMVQPIATGLRITLVFILMVILCVVISLLNSAYIAINKAINFKQYCSLVYKSAKCAFLEKTSSDVLTTFISNNRKIRGFSSFTKEQDVYNILVTIIFPLVIASYLGFSSGPLIFNPDFKPYEHVIFWFGLLIVGYILLFAYAFKYSNSTPFKMLLSNTAPYIKSGFNTGILSYFNVIIDKLAFFSTFMTFLSVATKHDRQYRKIIV